MDVGVNVLIMVLMMHMAFVFGSTPKRHFIKKGRKKKMVQKEEDKRSAKRNKMNVNISNLQLQVAHCRLIFRDKKKKVGSP